MKKIVYFNIAPSMISASFLAKMEMIRREKMGEVHAARRASSCSVNRCRVLFHRAQTAMYINKAGMRVNWEGRGISRMRLFFSRGGGIPDRKIRREG